MGVRAKSAGHRVLSELTIVTSCHNYGRYLGDWARSIVEQTVRPAATVIIDNGSTDHTPRDIEEAAAALNAAGIPCKTKRMPLVNFGAARNAAVELATTEWVQHLDADDMLMPHCLAEVEKLMGSADVISLGYQRCGDLKSGPHNLTKTYRSHQGQGTLDDTTPASGVSPFRRSLWKKSPYRTDMEGGWDTALWLGFAHQNARFRPVKKPCFWYRQHADSVFNVRRVDELKTRRVGSKLQSLRRGDAGVSLIVPWGDDRSSPRAAAWDWLRRRYEALFPEWEIVVGEAPAKPWNKGMAVNAAVQRSRGEFLVIADADCVVSAAALLEAVEALKTHPWVVPHTLVHRLNEDDTSAIISGRPDTEAFRAQGKLMKAPYEGYAGGGIVAIERAKFDAAGGFPTQFGGWGSEDEAFALILDTMVGPHARLKHDLFHLWHPPQVRDQSMRQANRIMLQRFRAVAGDRGLMWGLITHRLPDYSTIRPAIPLKMLRRFHPRPTELDAIIQYQELSQAGEFASPDQKARVAELVRINSLAIRQAQETSNRERAASTSFEARRLQGLVRKGATK